MSSVSGALARWQQEIHNGRRTRTTCDPLWAAACWEARGDPDALVVANEILAADAIRLLLEVWAASGRDDLAHLSDAEVDRVIARGAARTATLPVVNMRRLLRMYRARREAISA